MDNPDLIIERNYSALRTFIRLIKIITWLILIAGIVIVFLSPFLLLYMVIVIPIAVICLYATGEFLIVIIHIEENTRHSRMALNKIIEQTNSIPEMIEQLKNTQLKQIDADI